MLDKIPLQLNTYTDTTLLYIKKKNTHTHKNLQNLIKTGQLAIAQFILDIRKVLHYLIIYTFNCNKEVRMQVSYKGFIFIFDFEMADKILKPESPKGV